MNETITYARGRLVELKEKKAELERLSKDTKMLIKQNLDDDDLEAVELYLHKLKLYYAELFTTQTDINVLCKKWELQ